MTKTFIKATQRAYDIGAQVTSKDWINTLKDHGISISMDGRGRYLDNIFIERLWRSVKQEKIYRYDFETIDEVEQATTEYFDYYNHVTDLSFDLVWSAREQWIEQLSCQDRHITCSE